MSYRQPKTNNYFGFQPVSVGGGNVNFQVSPYLVSSSEGLINAGDVLTMTTLDTARVVTGAFIPTSSQAFLGVAANSMLANAGSTAATLVSNSSQMILVYDSPLQYFSGCDTTSGVGSNTMIGKDVVVLATGVVGSTGPNPLLARSVMALSFVAGSTFGAFKVISLDPIEQGIYSTVAVNVAATNGAIEVRKWIVQPALSVWAPSTSAVGIVNTTS